MLALARQAGSARQGRLFGTLRLAATAREGGRGPAQRWAAWTQRRATRWQPYSSAVGDGKEPSGQSLGERTEGEVKAEAEAAAAVDDEDDEEEEDEDADLDKVTVTDEEEEEDDEDDDSKIYSRNSP